MVSFFGLPVFFRLDIKIVKALQRIRWVITMGQLMYFAKVNVVVHVYRTCKLCSYWQAKGRPVFECGMYFITLLPTTLVGWYLGMTRI